MHMRNNGVRHHRDQCPRLLDPTPVPSHDSLAQIAPRKVPVVINARPTRARGYYDTQLFNPMPGRPVILREGHKRKVRESQQEADPEETVRRHYHRHMKHQPGRLQHRHQRVNLGIHPVQSGNKQDHAPKGGQRQRNMTFLTKY